MMKVFFKKFKMYFIAKGKTLIDYNEYNLNFIYTSWQYSNFQNKIRTLKCMIF